MQQQIHTARQWLRYQRRAKDGTQLSDPFVQDFYRHVLHGTAQAPTAAIEALRNELGQQDQRIVRHDLGAGTRVGSRTRQEEVPLSKLVLRSSVPRPKGEFLYRLCSYYQPRRALELGTHVGISALYQLAGMGDGRFVSIEGDPRLAALARRHLLRLGLKGEIMTGSFDEVLTQRLSPAVLHPDYVFLDGNHRYDATLHYFHLLLPHMQDGGIMVFDDIYWSEQMTRAWQAVCAHPEVQLSIDVFHLGVCFVRRPEARAHVVLRW
ncbi:MAG: hypothetical protein OHK0039_24730 [Bacteroidia bacterium]